ncbi:hypothetical protein ACFO5R_07025 [Halosolutus amylolyticus]|uniref:DUF7344 domain-containing protein n=1 Tax=Halosolutus amylolyticus TaxID=2932267 RepID=A0ABD5PMH7_9EURY|nr:hypothetical protein [Halosolutus amylolyticus]
MTTTSSLDRSTAALDSLCQSLASDRRRAILRLVPDPSSDGIEKADLATRLVAVTNDKPPGAVTDDERRRSEIELAHHDLPALQDGGLIATREDGAVVATDHPAVDENGIDDALAERSDADCDAVFEALADARRRTVLSVLENERGSLSARSLARSVAAREIGASERSVPSDRVDRVLASLVHVHLPTLADAGLVAYDDSAGRVGYEGHPLLRTGLIDLGRDTETTDEEAIDAVTEFAVLAPTGD